ncbi:MAG: hypothetical protein JWN32_3831 [Solirubrobacterales bacterium]|nr:hypothetical protein [Solirubrobacterales bacterium]
MIVRIAGEGQFRIDEECVARLNELDIEAVTAVEQGDEDKFHEIFARMIDIVRSDGKPLGDDELTGSDVIMPPADTSIDEARGEFTGEGLIPG